jgi:Ras-related protein Rab-7A
MVISFLYFSHIRDTCGQDSFETLGKVFYRGSDAAVLVYDVTNSKTFDDLERWLEEIRGAAVPDGSKFFPVVVFGNKCDLQGAQVSAKKAKSWAESKAILKTFETSAKEGTQVEQGFHDLIKSLMDACADGTLPIDDIDPLKLKPNHQAEPIKVCC